MISRRHSLLLATALLLGAGRDDELMALLSGGGDPSHALSGLAGIGFDSPTAPARRHFTAGLAHIAPDRAMTLESPMRVASISKHIAVLGFLQLAEQGRLGLDDDASDHLGFCRGWVGHLGEAYGLLSGLWIDPGGGAGRVYMLNGVSSGAEENAGGRSAFTRQEEALARLCGVSATSRRVGL